MRCWVQRDAERITLSRHTSCLEQPQPRIRLRADGTREVSSTAVCIITHCRELFDIRCLQALQGATSYSEGYGYRDRPILVTALFFPKRPYPAETLQNTTNQTPAFTVKRSERVLYKHYNPRIQYVTKTLLPFNSVKESDMFCLKTLFLLHSKHSLSLLQKQ